MLNFCFADAAADKSDKFLADSRDSKLKVTDSNAKVTLKGTTFKIQCFYGTMISTDDQ